MKQLLIALAGVALGIALGWGLKGQLASTDAQAESSQREPLYWVAPMDPNFRRNQPGKSPMGMDLIPVYAEDAAASDGDSTVRISPEVENNLGVRTAGVNYGPLALEIDTVGYVQFDEDTLSHLHPRVEGWIEKLHIAAVGDSVREGQVLFELYAPALLNAQQEYISALASGNRALSRASMERLRLLGMDRQQLEQLRKTRVVHKAVAYRAPVDGIISALNVREGMFINPSTEALAIGRLDHIWVIAEVFERQIGWLATGQPVAMTVDGYPGETWRGQVEFIYPELDPGSRTVRVRVRFANQDGRLKPNMFADLRIEAGDRRDRLSIPRSALIRGGRHDRVVKELGQGRYRSVLVQAGIEAADQVEILAGLAQGDRVVTSAQFLIDSESNIDAENVRMGEGAGEDGLPAPKDPTGPAWPEHEPMDHSAHEHLNHAEHAGPGDDTP